MIDATEYILIRSWMQGLSWSVIDEFYGDDDYQPSKRLKQILLDLTVKARFNNKCHLISCFETPPKNAVDQLNLLNIIKELDVLPYPVPALNHLVSDWFNQSIAKILVAHKIKTLGQLATLHSRGKRWFDAIPGFGATSAQTIDEWFNDNQHLLVNENQQQIKTAPSIKKTFAIVPLDYLLIPEPLLGCSDSEDNLLSAVNDIDAAYEWFALYQAKPDTQKAYSKEIERIILWLAHIKQKPLSKIDKNDCLAYREFLLKPEPRKNWVTAITHQRNDKKWKPFVLPGSSPGLSLKSIHYAESIIRKYMQWLTDNRYLKYNPYAQLSRILVEKEDPEFDPQPLLNALWEFLSRPNNSSEQEKLNIRMKIILHFLRSGSFSLTDIASLTIDCIIMDGMRPVGFKLNEKQIMMDREFRDDFDSYRLLYKLRVTSLQVNSPIISKTRTSQDNPVMTVRGLQKIIDKCITHFISAHQIYHSDWVENSRQLTIPQIKKWGRAGVS